MTRARLAAVLALCLLALSGLALGLPGCRCSGTNVVARVIQLSGTIERDHADRLGDWQRAAVGAEFHMGDGVRSSEQSGATLALARKARLRLGPRSMVRFLARARPGQTAIDVQVGEAILETESETLHIDSLVGGVVIEPKSKVHLRKSSKGLRFEVAVGSVRFDDQKLVATPVVAGYGIEISVGGVVLDRYGVDQAAPQSSAGPGPRQPDQEGGASTVHARVDGTGASRSMGGGVYQPMQPGPSTLAPGTTIKIEADTQVLVERGDERARLGQGEFVVGAPGGYLVEAVRGPIRLSSSGQTSIRVPGGVIVAGPRDSSADVEVRPDKATAVDVHLGSVTVKGRGTEQVHAGEMGTLSADGQISIQGRGGSVPDLVARPGASFTVHDPSPPTGVGLSTRDLCPGGARVRVSEKLWASGKDLVTLSLSPGAYQYQVHCLGPDGPEERVAASGKVVVLHDGGTAPVVRTAPATSVETDGRRYTVLYQSRLPKISVNWSAAPAASHYTLHVDSRTIRTSKASYSFGEGAMAEGAHTVFFEAPTDPPRRSRDTTVMVSLDRATPTATIQNPPNGTFKPGSAVRVSGAALPGWKVRVGDQEIQTDGQSRFEADVEVPSDRACLPVAFESPTGGTHYYLRRPSTGP